MNKLTIKNRKDQKIVVILEEPEHPAGLAFVMHGLGGFKEQGHIRVMVESFLGHGYRVVSFDSTNGIGESDGSLDKVTVTGNLEDLEDVISWASEQDWFTKPFVLAGHSMGSMCAVLYASSHPADTKALAPISTVLSGKLRNVTPEFKKLEAAWKETKWFISDSRSKPGVIKKIPWSFNIDLLKYDLIPIAPRLTMPVLLAVGEFDPGTPREHQKLLYDALPQGKKELHIIKDAPHTFRKPHELRELRKLFDQWLDGLD